jgi:hypothetical protein
MQPNQLRQVAMESPVAPENHNRIGFAARSRQADMPRHRRTILEWLKVPGSRA